MCVFIVNTQMPSSLDEKKCWWAHSTSIKSDTVTISERK
ncbi:hypothetical protein EL78_5083 [Escherichia coli]|nr:hypothetical protein EL78_5083 [Escherichia coli]